jgi:hypothetical protein
MTLTADATEGQSELAERMLTASAVRSVERPGRGAKT